MPDLIWRFVTLPRGIDTLILRRPSDLRPEGDFSDRGKRFIVGNADQLRLLGTVYNQNVVFQHFTRHAAGRKS
jgi:hypothetical protein